MTSASTSPDAAAHWNGRFAGEDFLFGTEPNVWLRDHASTLPPGGRILCVADGEGRNGVYLARRGFTVDAFDISDVARSKAMKLAAAAGVTISYTLADSDGFGWAPQSYDGVVAIFVQFADPAMRARMFAHIVDCLKPGGILILQGYTPKQLDYRTGGPPHVEHLYTEPMLRDAFAAMTSLELREYEAEVAEGSGHRGRSALIGMVAQR